MEKTVNRYIKNGLPQMRQPVFYMILTVLF